MDDHPIRSYRGPAGAARPVGSEFGRKVGGGDRSSTERTMIKVFFCVTKKPGMSGEDFHRYWKDVHGQIAAKIPGIRRYVQHHTAYPTPPIGIPSYDGVAEFWFDDYPSVEKALSSPEVATSLSDHPNFMADNSACALFITEEHVVIDGAT